MKIFNKIFLNFTRSIPVIMAEQMQMTWYGAGGRFHNKIYVGNLSSRTRDDDIRDVFIKYGDVVDIVLKYDFAFVEMENEKDMEEAIEYDEH